MGAQGTAIVNFGSPPGTNIVSVVVTGQSAILAGSLAEAFMMADTTVTGSAGHNAEEHKIVPMNLRCGSVVPGVGFTIYAETEWRLTSTFMVRWVWN